jgi:hypothetical protein
MSFQAFAGETDSWVVQEMSEPPPAPLEVQLVVLGSDGFVSPDAWPSACDLLTDAEVRGVLPQVEDIRRESESREFDVYETFDTFTVTDAVCVHELDMPDAGVPFESPGLPPSVRVEVRAVGLPGFIDQNFRPQEEPVAVPEGECDDISFGSTTCHDEGIVVDVDFDPRHREVSDEVEGEVEVALARRILAKVPTPTGELPPPSP